MQDQLLWAVAHLIRIFTAQETYFETLVSLAQFLNKRQFCLSNNTANAYEGTFLTYYKISGP
jgi:hypothetical protein